MKTLVNTTDISGISAVEWSQPVESDHETWLVVMENQGKPSPRAYRLGLSEFRQEHGSLPFKSQILSSVHSVKRARRLSVFKRILATAFILVCAVSSLAFLTGSLQFRFVLSDSMSGTYERGDLIAVISPRFFEVGVDSVVMFHYYNQDRTSIVGDFSHRVIGGNAEEGWETKGDANDLPELSPVFSQDIIGGVVATVPKVGLILQPTNILAIALVAVLLSILAPDVRRLIRNR